MIFYQVVIMSDHTFITNENLIPVYQCDICSTTYEPVIVPFITFFDHLVHHLFDSYRTIVNNFAPYAHTGHSFYFPLTPGYVTFTPYMFLITSNFQRNFFKKYLIIDFSTILTFHVLVHSLESAAEMLFFDNFPDYKTIFFQLNYTVQLQSYQNRPSINFFNNKTELIKISGNYSYSDFSSFDDNSINNIITAFTNFIFDSITLFFKLLARSNPIYQQFLSLTNSCTPVYLSSRHENFVRESIIALELINSYKNNLRSINCISLEYSRSTNVLSFSNFLYTCLEVVNYSKESKHSYNFLQSLYYYLIHSTLEIQKLSSPSTNPF